MCRNSRSLESRSRDVLERLNIALYPYHKDRISDRIPGTCDWFVTHRTFKVWQESPKSQLLWVSTNPGCGKSVMMRYLVESVLTSNASRTVLYFFFNDDSEDKRSIVNAMRCILYQLFKQHPNLLTDKILERFETDDRITNSFSELWDILFLAAKQNANKTIICLLDALDECDKSGASQLIEALGKVYKNETANRNLKFLIASRPYDYIRQGLRPLMINGQSLIHLSDEGEAEMKDLSREIDIFIRAKVNTIGDQLQLTNEERNSLDKGIIGIKGIAEITSSLPQSVDEAYERILSKSTDAEQAKILLHVVIGAARPLSVPEINFVLTLQDDHTSYSDLNLEPDYRCIERIKSICGLFIIITYAFLDYSAKHWTAHLLASDIQMEPLNPSLLKLCDGHETLSRNWIRICWDNSTADVPYGYTSAILASYFGLVSVVQHLKNVANIDWKSKDTKHGRSALSWAAGNGHSAVVQFLTRRIWWRRGKGRRAVDSKDWHDRTPLSWAIMNGHEEAAKILLEAGASIDSMDQVGATPLDYAKCRRLHGLISNAKTIMVKLHSLGQLGMVIRKW
ncbi:hypothetical protein BDV25DRAFT_126348 [Aspergillus avenaceus]|uniref:Nephrocystin 3-like N-terminal domain-containing protein n=1 Tax=Aspergillus avenaceus TaxID=36643 RepID=A0A5N6U7Q9_ASPAV|nr:hypothetical protein BDV25DRAFT_126348 [Aspergillus avenaceus]